MNHFMLSITTISIGSYKGVRLKSRCFIMMTDHLIWLWVVLTVNAKLSLYLEDVKCSTSSRLFTEGSISIARLKILSRKT